MDTNVLNELRGALESELNTVKEELATHGRSVPQGAMDDWQGSSGGLSGEEADPTDAADNIEELITNVPLVEELEQRYKEVRDALSRIESGSYGTCDVCDAQIPIERLKANPAAKNCMAHSN